MTPSEAILSAGSRENVVRDELGRSLAVKHLSALDALRLIKAAGPVLSQNEAWMSIASLASAVCSIDGVPIPAPSSEAQIEAAVARLGNEGLGAVSRFMEDGTGSAVADPVQNVGN